MNARVVRRSPNLPLQRTRRRRRCVARPQSGSLQYHPQPQYTKSLGLHGQPQKGTAELHGCRSCRNNACCCADEGVVLAKRGWGVQKRTICDKRTVSTSTFKNTVSTNHRRCDHCTHTPQAPQPGLCLVILGGGGGVKLAPGILADPPTHPHQEIFPQEKNEIYQRGPNLEVDFRYTNFFLASDPPTHPPPPPPV